MNREDVESEIESLLGRADVIDYDFGPGTIEAELLLKRAVRLRMQLDDDAESSTVSDIVDQLRAAADEWNSWGSEPNPAPVILAAIAEIELLRGRVAEKSSMQATIVELQQTISLLKRELKR